MRRSRKWIDLPAAGNWLLAGTFVTTVGNGVHTFTAGKLLFDLTGSVAAFGIVIIIEQAANVLMQLVAGPWVDRGNSKRTLIQVELIRGGVICIASLLLGTQSLFAWVMLMTLVIRVAQPFYRAATFSLGPAVVPAHALGRFNGFSNMCLQAGQLVGVAVAGVVLERWGATPAFLINGLSFLFSALTAAVITPPEAAPEVPPAAAAQAPQHLLQAWTEVAVLLRTQAGLVWHLVLGTADSVAVYLFNLLIVAVVAARLGGSAEWLSAIEVAFAVGAIASGAVVDRLSARWDSRVSVVIGIGGQAAAFALLGLQRDTLLTLPLAFALGACNTISWTVVVTSLQLRVGKHVKARIGTARNLLTALITVGLVPLVSTLQLASLEWALFLSAGVCLAFALVAVVLGHTRVLGTALLGDTPTRKAAPNRSTPELAGSLSGLDLARVLRLFSGLSNSIRLRIAAGPWSGEVALDGGEVVAAQLGEERGLSALAGMAFVLPHGQLTFAEDEPPRERNVSMTPEELVAFVEQMTAASARVACVLPGLNGVPRVLQVPELPDGPKDLVLRRDTLHTLLAVDGHRTVEQIALTRGVARAAMDLATCVELTLIQVDPARSEERSA